jgi:hypothetical protein
MNLVACAKPAYIFLDETLPMDWQATTAAVLTIVAARFKEEATP